MKYLVFREMKYLVFILAFFSCNTERQLQKAEVRLASAGRLPQICQDRFPARDSIVYRDSVSYDSIWLETSVTDTLNTKDTIQLPSVTKTVYKFRDVYSLGTAQLAACQAQATSLQRVIGEQQRTIADQASRLAACDTTIQQWKNKASQRIWLWIIIGLLVGWIVRKPLTALLP